MSTHLKLSIHKKLQGLLSCGLRFQHNDAYPQHAWEISDKIQNPDLKSYLTYSHDLALNGICILRVLRYMVWRHFWPYGLEQLQNFLSHLNSLRPSIQFTMEIGSDSEIPFLDVLVIRKRTALATKGYRKPTHTDWYLNFKSIHREV
jgi:hypothetical protein